MIDQTLALRIANEGSGRLVCPPPTLHNMRLACLATLLPDYYFNLLLLIFLSCSKRLIV